MHDSRYSWMRLGVSLLIAVIGNVGMWAIIVILPAIQAEYGVDRAGAAFPYTMTMVGFAFGNLAMGRAVDRFGITATLIGAAAAICTGMVAAVFAPSIGWLAAAQILVGFGNSATFGPLIADISHWFLRRRGIAMAIAASGNYLSGAIWPVLLAGVLRENGWRAVYWTLIAVTLAVIVPLALALRARMTEEGNARAAAARPVMSAGISNRSLIWLLGLAGIGCCVAMSMPQVHIVAFAVDLGFGPAVGAQMLSLMLMGGVVSRLVSGLLADWLGGVRTLLIGATLQALALFLYLPFDGLVSLYLVSTIFGLSQGGIVPSYAVIVREYLPAKQAGTQVGFVMMATIVGMALGGWMSGWLYDVTGSYAAAILNGIGWNLLTIAIMVLILSRSRPARMARA